MESKTKADQFSKLLKDAVKQNDVLTVKLLTELRTSIPVNLSQEKFDEVIFNKIENLALSASSLLKKKQKTLGEQDIYCINLLSHCFFNGKINVSIENTNVVVNDNRNINADSTTTSI
jgi:hypothetical protein